MPYATNAHQIYMRFLHKNNSNTNWEMIYPYYTQISLYTTGYVVFSNSLILQWIVLINSDWTIYNETNKYIATKTLPIYMPILFFGSVTPLDLFLTSYISGSLTGNEISFQAEQISNWSYAFLIGRY